MKSHAFASDLDSMSRCAYVQKSVHHTCKHRSQFNTWCTTCKKQVRFKKWQTLNHNYHWSTKNNHMLSDKVSSIFFSFANIILFCIHHHRNELLSLLFTRTSTHISAHVVSIQEIEHINSTHLSYIHAARAPRASPRKFVRFGSHLLELSSFRPQTVRTS